LFRRRNPTDHARFDERDRKIEEHAAAAGLYGGPTEQQILLEATQHEREEIETEHGEPAVRYANAKTAYDDVTADLEALKADDSAARAAKEAEAAWERALTAGAPSRRLWPAVLVTIVGVCAYYFATWREACYLAAALLVLVWIGPFLLHALNAARWVLVAMFRLAVRQARIVVAHPIRLYRRGLMRKWKRRSDVVEAMISRRLSRLTGCYDRVYAMARAVSENRDAD
jgi:hypothetical protein